MSDTRRFKRPLLNAAQAQKHVTLNEALVRVDALGAARVERRDLSVPPTSVADGDAYIIGPGATEDWAGRDGDLALFSNGGWDIVIPWSGCRVWIAAEGAAAVFNGTGWIVGHTTGSPGRAATLSRIVQIDHVLAAGAMSTTEPVIPDKAVMLGVTGRVIEEITGATSWSLGVPGAGNRYGSGYGTGVNSYAHGLAGWPQTYYSHTPLMVMAEGGSFTAGSIRLAAHFLEIAVPDAV